MRLRLNCIVLGGMVTLGVVVICINYYEMRELRKAVETNARSAAINKGVGVKSTGYYVWIHPENRPHLHHVTTVFQRVGYELSQVGWHVMWSHDYPFGSRRAEMMNLKEHQKVNHFAGTGYFTNKASLAGANFSFMPKSFRLPQESASFKKEAVAHPEELWVMKSNEHRGIRVLHTPDLKSRNSFLQQFIRHPLLIDKRKFDIGLYVVITSVDPLRVYVYNEEVLLRFCAKDYEPFDADSIDSYVVGDDYTPTWEIPSLQQLYNRNKLSHKKTLSVYLQGQGHDTNQMWSEMYKAVVMVILNYEPLVAKATRLFADPKHFFELVRFDFVIDEKLRVWLMEVNMSPNLSSVHFPPNAVLYEQVIFNLFTLVGVAKVTHSHNNQLSGNMEVSDRDVQVATSECLTSSCDECFSLSCRLCYHCRSQQLTNILKSAFLEHVHRRSYKRLFPPPLDHGKRWGSVSPSNYSDANKLMILWFMEKCKEDTHWCT